MQALFRLCRLVAVILLASLSLITPALATSFTTDQSDIWSAVGEDGWAIQSEIVERVDHLQRDDVGCRIGARTRCPTGGNLEKPPQRVVAVLPAELEATYHQSTSQLPMAA